MNHIYRLVWNDLTRAWVAVAEIVTGRAKPSSATMGQPPRHQRRLVAWNCVEDLRGRQILAASLALSFAMMDAPAWALVGARASRLRRGRRKRRTCHRFFSGRHGRASRCSHSRCKILDIGSCGSRLLKGD